MILVNASAGPSRIHGTGLIANVPISAGTVIWVLKPGFDLVLTKRELDELSPVAQEQIRNYIYIDVDTGKYVLCSDDAKFMNHSDSPNTSTQAGQTVALCDIEAGTELTGDYREFDAATRGGKREPQGTH
jgi:SET domain-containing protein